jgi:phosphopantothenoylcysteine synthetase/decarboxylase
MKVLVTSGGTVEPIDGVRFITNFSTGATGAFLADSFSELGWSVTQLRASGSVVSSKSKRSASFRTFKDLELELQTLLKADHYDAVLHVAAVSDYAVDQIRVNGKTLEPRETGKLSSNGSIELVLKPNPKLIDDLKTHSQNSKIKVVGFKLTSAAASDERWEAVKKLTFNPEIDFVVLNDLSEIITSLNQHKCQIYKNGKCLIQTHTKAELAMALNNYLREAL